MTARYEEGRMLVTVPEAGPLETGTLLDEARSNFMGVPCSVVRRGTKPQDAMRLYRATTWHPFTW